MPLDRLAPLEDEWVDPFEETLAEIVRLARIPTQNGDVAEQAAAIFAVRQQLEDESQDPVQAATVFERAFNKAVHVLVYSQGSYERAEALARRAPACGSRVTAALVVPLISFAVGADAMDRWERIRRFYEDERVNGDEENEKLQSLLATGLAMHGRFDDARAALALPHHRHQYPWTLLYAAGNLARLAVGGYPGPKRLGSAEHEAWEGYARRIAAVLHVYGAQETNANMVRDWALRLASRSVTPGQFDGAMSLLATPMSEIGRGPDFVLGALQGAREAGNVGGAESLLAVHAPDYWAGPTGGLDGFAFEASIELARLYLAHCMSTRGKAEAAARRAAAADEAGDAKAAGDQRAAERRARGELEASAAKARAVLSRAAAEVRSRGDVQQLTGLVEDVLSALGAGALEPVFHAISAGRGGGQAPPWDLNGFCMRWASCLLDLGTPEAVAELQRVTNACERFVEAGNAHALAWMSEAGRLLEDEAFDGAVAALARMHAAGRTGASEAYSALVRAVRARNGRARAATMATLLEEAASLGRDRLWADVHIVAIWFSLGDFSRAWEGLRYAESEYDERAEAARRQQRQPTLGDRNLLKYLYDAAALALARRGGASASYARSVQDRARARGIRLHDSVVNRVARASRGPPVSTAVVAAPHGAKPLLLDAERALSVTRAPRP